MRVQHDNSKGTAGTAAGWRWLMGEMALALLLGLGAAAPLSWAEEAGVTDKAIRIGATIPLQGDYKVYGLSMKQGMDATLAGQTVQKRAIEFIVINVGLSLGRVFTTICGIYIGCSVAICRVQAKALQRFL